MNLEEFMQTDIYKGANCISYNGVDGMKLEYDDILLDCKVLNYHMYSGECLEIKLNTL